MKTNSVLNAGLFAGTTTHNSASLGKAGRIVGAIAFALALSALPARSASSFVAHEWGTFTSVQGSDGSLLDWHPLESSELPEFVFDWKKPGLDRQPGGAAIFTKTAIVSRQRMETPVIYFYSDEPRTVDVTVDFPQGLITEWYPQAAQIGPSFPKVAAVQDGQAAHTSVPGLSCFEPNLKESRAHWAQVELLPAKQNLDASLPRDKSGSHYFAARETDAAYVRVNSLDSARPHAEQEKFIFYRGVGNFTTPLRVTIDAGGAVTIHNTGSEPLVHLFVLGLEHRAGKFTQITRLAAGEKQTLRLEIARQAAPVEKVSRQLGMQMAEALVEQGLYRREAAAMVKTWRDSWFEEDGLRVLYMLPRTWTDTTLPLAIKPAPESVVRVMVGRAEVLTPTVEQSLAANLIQANQGDITAREQVLVELHRLGRFADPALRLATKGFDQNASQTAWQLFQSASKTSFAAKPL